MNLKQNRAGCMGGSGVKWEVMQLFYYLKIKRNNKKCGTLCMEIRKKAEKKLKVSTVIHAHIQITT